MAKAPSKTAEPFGARLRRPRTARGLTQQELGGKIGLSKRMFAYCEIQGGTPSHAQLALFAKVLGVSADELVGTAGGGGGEPADAPHGSAELRLWRWLRQIQKLPPAQRRAVLKVLDALPAQHIGSDNQRS